jgi:hypothetical protein
VDFPDPPRLPMDRYEYLTLRRWRDSRPAAPLNLAMVDDLL